MPIPLNCPRCKAPVSLPDSSAGQYDFCPKCNGRVWVPGRATAAQPAEQSVAAAQGSATPTASGKSTKQPPATSPPPAKMPPASPPPSPTSAQPKPPGKAADPMAPVGQSPGATKPTPPHSAPPPAPPSPGATSTPPPVAPTGAGGRDRRAPHPQQQPPPPAQSSPMAAVSGDAAAGRPARRVATLITADVAQSELAPAADGQLPDLQLTEQDKKAKKQASSSTMQWRIVILVAASLTLSVVMMMDFGTGGTRRTKADAAREDIKRKYIGSEDKPLEPYQGYLRKALVAHASGDLRTERAYYQRVLGLLRAENFERDPERKGLTGIRDEPDDKDLPNDVNLEMLLNILISSR